MVDDYERLNVINAAKAWYRKITYGAKTDEERKAIIDAISPSLRRLALMVQHLTLAEEKKEGRKVPPPPSPRRPKKKSRDHLRVVK
jgi:hypothetical protein